jgi:dihydroorotate dehydrogenase electron transfer subunit
MYKESKIYQKETGEVKDYCRAAAFLYKEQNKRKVKILTKTIIPIRYNKYLKNLSDDEIGVVINNHFLNRQKYNSLCLKLLSIIFNYDNLHIEYLNPDFFSMDFLIQEYTDTTNNIIFDKYFSECALIIRDKHSRFIFSFAHQDDKELEKIADYIYQRDKNQYGMVNIIIMHNNDELKKARDINNADKWKRSFFTSFTEIRKKAEILNKKELQKFYALSINDQETLEYKLASDIKYFTAEVLDNIPIGKLNIEKKDPDYYKLRFKVQNNIQNILPGQFIMIETLPQTISQKIRSPKKNIYNSWSEIKSSDSEVLKTKQSSYLKRPFGIHRAYYKYFNKIDYLKHLKLPTHLATILRTVYPHELDVLYKVIKNGIGTHELKDIKKGNKLHIIGPLGKKYNLRSLRDQGVEEIHVIGGGVGMAPLVLLVQALKFFSFNIKAFVGIENLKMLNHGDGYYENTFVDDPQNVKIYYDDLLSIGLTEENIYVTSMESKDDQCNIRNFQTGLISDYYRKYLTTHNNIVKVKAFTCGPFAMMKEIYKITTEYKIPLQVFMEKRMACGIGVCLSCVCKTKKNDKATYSRVCVEGPLFNAEEIVWSS